MPTSSVLILVFPPLMLFAGRTYSGAPLLRSLIN